MLIRATCFHQLRKSYFESVTSARVFRRGLEPHIVHGLARALTVVLLIYLALKAGNLAVKPGFSYLFNGSMESGFFLLEVVVGVLLPLGLLASSFRRLRLSTVSLAVLLVILGVMLNRMNVSIVGLWRTAGVAYFPSWMEWTVMSGVAAMEVLAFMVIVRHFPIHTKEEVPVPTRKALAPAAATGLPWPVGGPIWASLRPSVGGVRVSRARPSPWAVAGQPCWETKRCPPEVRRRCPAATLSGLPCWAATALVNGNIKEECRSCALFQGASVS